MTLKLNDLPPELLASIFDAYADLYRPCDSHSIWIPQHKHDDMQYLMRLPMDLSLLCRLWRDVAYAMPSLWCTLLLNSSGGDVANAIQALEMRIKRSGTLTLSLYASEDWPTPSRWGNGILLLLQEFIDRYSHRWARIQLDVGNHYANYSTGLRLAASSQTFPHLRELALGTVFACSRAKTIIQEGRVLFPRMERLALSEVDLYALEGIWGRLTTLDLHYVHVGELVFAMDQTPNLTHLRIIDSFKERGFDPEKTLTHPRSLHHLRTLDIMAGMYDHDATAISIFLASFRAPNLKRLRCITANGTPRPWSEDNLDVTPNVLIPSPGTSCPDIIIVGEDSRGERTFDLNFVQRNAPEAHVVLIGKYLEGSWDPRGWWIPPLWSNCPDVCPACFLHEGDDKGHPSHHSGVHHYPAGVDEDTSPCAVCRRLLGWAADGV